MHFTLLVRSHYHSWEGIGISMKKHMIEQKTKTFILILFIASLVWTYFSFLSTPENIQENDISLTASPEYEITSRKEVIPYPYGTIFDLGLATYFYATDPEINVNPKISVSGTGKLLIRGILDSQVILQAIDDEGQIYWKYVMRELPQQGFELSQNTEGEADHESFTSKPIFLNANAAYRLGMQIANELMFQNGTIQMLLTCNIRLNGSSNNTEFEKNMSVSLPLTLQQAGFVLPKPSDAATELSITIPKTNVEQIPKFLSEIRRNSLQLATNFILLILLVFTLFLFRAKQSKMIILHRRFKEWITEGYVEIPDKLVVSILNLEGLVDLAIDLNKRVIYDNIKDQYFVLTEDMVYLYDPDQLKALRESRQKLGKLLTERGLIDIEQLEIGLYYHKKSGTRLGESLIALGFIDEATLYSTLASQNGMDYYEIDTDKEVLFTEWLNQVSIQKARALQILPLGIREDGNLVIACGEIFRSGLHQAMQDMFGSNITLVSSRPSVIYKLLDKLDLRERQQKNLTGQIMQENRNPVIKTLSSQEVKRFQTSYEKGKLDKELFLKALNIVDTSILMQSSEQENALNWLVSKNYLEAEYPNLLKGLDKSVHDLSRKQRGEKIIPLFQNILLNANYLTQETLVAINQRPSFEIISLEQLLIKEYFVSEKTLKKVAIMQERLNELLNS